MFGAPNQRGWILPSPGPTVDKRPQVGDLWFNTTDGVLYYCQAADPVAWAAVDGGGGGGGTPSGTVADLDGTGNAGVSATYSRGDHKHADANRPTDDEKGALAGTGTPSAANPYVVSDDSRMTDARTPTAHNTSHQDGGSDEISVAGLSGLLADAQTPLAHKTSHQDGGADELSVTGLSGLLADAQTPLAHAANHSSGGSDPVTVTDLAGFPGGGTTFLRDDGTFAAPGGGGSDWDITVTKSVDETVTSNTVVQDDDELKIPVVDGEVWWVEVLVAYTADVAGDIKIGFRNDAGTTFDGMWKGLGLNTTNSPQDQVAGAIQTVAFGGGTGGDVRLARCTVTMAATSTGNFVMQWAQNASHATGTVVKAGSLMRARQII